MGCRGAGDGRSVSGSDGVVGRRGMGGRGMDGWRGEEGVGGTHGRCRPLRDPGGISMF
jgi:hypothetical protein